MKSGSGHLLRLTLFSTLLPIQQVRRLRLLEAKRTPVLNNAHDHQGAGDESRHDLKLNQTAFPSLIHRPGHKILMKKIDRDRFSFL